MFYCVMKGIQKFAANLLSYVPTKYYYKKAQLSPTNPRDACENFARFT